MNTFILILAYWLQIFSNTLNLTKFKATNSTSSAVLMSFSYTYFWVLTSSFIYQGREKFLILLLANKRININIYVIEKVY